MSWRIRDEGSRPADEITLNSHACRPILAQRLRCLLPGNAYRVHSQNLDEVASGDSPYPATWYNFFQPDH